MELEQSMDGWSIQTKKGKKSAKPKMSMSERKKHSDDIKASGDHLLQRKWVLWAHLPHDTNWTINSYKKIMTITTLEQLIALYRVIPEKMVKNCMLFLMQENINPIWEDPRNKNGGCFSFKIPNKNVHSVWKQTSYSVLGECISDDAKFLRNVNGITISPKKSFCILKIWMSNLQCQNPRKINAVKGLSIGGCLFKKHKPEY